MITTQVKIQDLLKDLNLIDTASLIHTASEGIRQGISFGHAYTSLGVFICDLDQDGFLSDHIKDVSDQKELVNLITAASFRLQIFD